MQRRFRLQRAGAIGASSMVTPPTESGQGNLESCIECVPRPGRGAGRTAASKGGGGCCFIGSPARSGHWPSAVLAIPQDRFDYNTGGIAVVLYRHQQPNPGRHDLAGSGSSRATPERQLAAPKYTRKLRYPCCRSLKYCV